EGFSWKSFHCRVTLLLGQQPPSRKRRKSESLMRCTSRNGLFVLLLSATSLAAETTLPVVEEVEWTPFRDHGRQLLKALAETKAPLSAETVRAVRGLLDKKPNDPQAAARAVQQLLDPHCLLAVDINPESRVKAIRGPAVPTLRQNEETLVLIKV